MHTNKVIKMCETHMNKNMKLYRRGKKKLNVNSITVFSKVKMLLGLHPKNTANQKWGVRNELKWPILLNEKHSWNTFTR